MSKENINSEIFSELNFNASDVKKYISQNNYKEEMLNKVEPYLKEKRKSGYISGKDNLKLYYEKFIMENAKANIVICHGFAEYTEKYYELIYYFIREGYSVFIIEHRGHGRSERLGIDNSQINVEKFNYYVEDFKKFIDEIVIPNSKNKNLLLFAHSMGGAIGTDFLEKYTNYFQAAVLSSPMHEINTGKHPKILANIISMLMKLCGKKLMYLPGQVPYTGEKNISNKATSCAERYEYQYEKITKNNSYQSGGSSALWYIESSKAIKKLLKKQNASKVIIPIILFQTEYDLYVMPKAQNKFASRAKNCELIHVEKSKHEAYFEKDEIAFTFIDRILSFYENNYK
mgnify:CR=1 FL=1